MTDPTDGLGPTPMNAHAGMSMEVKEGEDFMVHFNDDCLETRTHCKLEPSLGVARSGDRYQFERLGYFCADPDGTPTAPVFNRTLSLRDSWAKIDPGKKGKGRT